MFVYQAPDYAGYLPNTMLDVQEIEEIRKAVNPELELLFGRVQRAVENRFTTGLDLEGAARFEQILGLSTPLNGTLKARREAIRAKLMTKPPINMETVRSIIEAYMGVPVDLEEQNYLLRAWYRGTSQTPDLEPLRQTLYQVIPAALLLEILYRYLTWTELDRQNLSFEQLDAKKLDWDTFERGEWVG